MWPWDFEKRHKKSIQAEVDRLDQTYGEAAYIQALAVAEELVPHSPQARVMRYVLTELSKMRGDQLASDNELVGSYKRIGLWG